MEKQNKQQEKLDLLYKDQMRLDLQLEDNQDEQKAIRQLRDDLEYSQGDALYQLNDLLLMGVTPSHRSFYIQLLEQMDATTRKIFLDLDEQELQLKQQYRETERQLEIVQKKRSHLLNELAEKEEKQKRY
jgi:predicted kinase